MEDLRENADSEQSSKKDSIIQEMEREVFSTDTSEVEEAVKMKSRTLTPFERSPYNFDNKPPDSNFKGMHMFESSFLLP